MKGQLRIKSIYNFYRFQQFRQIILDYIPYNFKVYSEIFVNKKVPEILDVLPLDIGIFQFDAVGQFPYGFADYFEFPDNGRKGLPVV